MNSSYRLAVALDSLIMPDGGTECKNLGSLQREAGCRDLHGTRALDDDEALRSHCIPLPCEEVRARECDQKSCWREPVPPPKHASLTITTLSKRWAAEIIRITVTQRDLSLAGGIRMSSAKMDCEL